MGSRSKQSPASSSGRLNTNKALSVIETIKQAKTQLYYVSPFLSHVSNADFDPRNPGLGAQAVQAGGRQSAWYINTAAGPAVLRHYRRGGLIAKLIRDRYLWLGWRRSRAWRELVIMQYLRQADAPVPQPLAAATWHDGLSYQAAIMIQRIPDVQTLAQAVEQAPLKQVAKAILAVHDAGVWHADLNAHNILIDKQQQVFIIDFDRAQRRTMKLKQRKNNLNRLRRSLIKVAQNRGQAYWEELNKAYFVLLKQRSV